MTSDQVSSQESNNSQISTLQRIVEQLRLNLYVLEEQAALHGPLDIPIRIRNAIEETTKLLGHKEAELRDLQSRQGDNQPQNTELKKFWEPFISEGAEILVPHDEPGTTLAGTRMKVLVLTMQGVFNMYRLLVEQFANSCRGNRIRLDVGGAIKTDTRLERLGNPTFPHLIVIGAPGSHPLSNYLMCHFKGLLPRDDNNIVRQGYVFRVSGNYLDSPFIVTDATLSHYSPEEQNTMQELGIYDLRPDRSPKHFPRIFKQYDVPGYKDHDCAIVVTGWASLPGQNQIRRVVIVAGHSRHSTLFGTTFIATNEEWAQRVNALSYYNTETIIGFKPDPVGIPVAPTILAGPREIYKQSPDI